MDDVHRKRVRHFDHPGHVHELTFSCYQRRPLLVDDACRSILATAVTRAMLRHRYGLVAFVFMPEHVHLLVLPESRTPISAVLSAIKRPTAFRIKQHWLEHQDSRLQGLIIRQRPGVSTFRFWQEGPGYDRNVTTAGTIQKVIEYLHLNPVRRGLCRWASEWRWSSARRFADPDGPDDPDLPTVRPLLPADFDPDPTA